MGQFLKSWSSWLRFDQCEALPHGSGVYEIRCGAELLKVGIAGDLHKRLRAHARSAQRRLLSKDTPPWPDPSGVKSSQSILAKHLYFDRSLAPAHDLRVEADRLRFLNEKCQFRYRTTETREEARTIEVELEKSGAYRYVGPVRIR
jgi:hypothetical protein